MTYLSTIQPAVQQVAEAISAALGVATEICDDEITVIAGTGKYRERIGQKEEAGSKEAGLMYGQVLTTGKAFVVADPANDPLYGPLAAPGKEGEQAELCVPINFGSRPIGVMALVAFNRRQRDLLLGRQDQFLVFIARMGELLASKVSESLTLNKLRETTGQLEAIIESINEGVLATDSDAVITHFAPLARRLLGEGELPVVGRPLAELWPDSPVLRVVKDGVGYAEKEEIYGSSDRPLLFLVTATPIKDGPRITGAVVLFRDMAQVRRLVYDMSVKVQDQRLDDIKGKSVAIRELTRQAQKIANSSATVLITGESGTGKDLLARAIHWAGPRRRGPFIAVNCGAIPDQLLESELFGYEEGAFTGARKGGKAGKFELADGGTIFLDEIGDLPLHLQVKLLHVLQHKSVERVGSSRNIPVDVRVIAATNRDLERMVEEGGFRADLYFRLNVIPLYVPTLRERKEDIPILMEHFLQIHRTHTGKPVRGFDEEVSRLFEHYDWPGNVRELENAVEYAVNMVAGEWITLESIPVRIRRYAQYPDRGGLSLRSRLQEYERRVLEECLDRYGNGSQVKELIARELKVSRATLYRRLQEYGLLQK
ncbi:MAG: sigma 54-interacting transcriptional regulator [Firmicutes bacterium]|nr:sigma 54-interacting transcriptional regulator [Bacillota bacterium]